MRLIFDSGLSAFPPRLDWQSIFYPVLNFNYAAQIARDWNTKDSNSDYAGYVTMFDVEETYVEGFEAHTVGASQHQELWVPAEELDEFNRHIQGQIRVPTAHFGHDYEMVKHAPEDLSAGQIIELLNTTLNTSPVTFVTEISRQRQAIYLNFLYWFQSDMHELALDLSQNQSLLDAVTAQWEQQYPDLPLPGRDGIPGDKQQSGG